MEGEFGPRDVICGIMFFDLLYLLLSFTLADVLENIFQFIRSVGSFHPLTLSTEEISPVKNVFQTSLCNTLQKK